MIRVPKLCPKDAVGIVAPAGLVDASSLQKGVKAVLQMGFTPCLGRFINAKERYLAGSDQDRAEDLMAMFQNREIKAIFCARGGYGVNRVLPLLKPAVIRKNPKIVLGSSDITLLLWYLNRKCSLTAFHGPMVAASFGRRSMSESQKMLKELLAGRVSAKKIRCPSAQTIRLGKASGVLTGGCLTLLCRSLKTPYEIRTDGTILLIEDVQERPYRIDGMLWQLRQAGKFKNVQGVILGEMVDCHPGKHEGYSLQDVIADFFRNDDFPVLMNCPIGHGEEIWTLPLGVKAELDSESRKLTLTDCGVI